jgi:hypothetical protein
MEVKCPSCGSLKVYKSFKDKKTKVKINICDSCYFIYQPPCQDLDYYKIKCTTTKVLDLEKHSQDTADYIFNFSKKFINSPNSILEIGASSPLTLQKISKYFPSLSKLCGLNLPLLNQPTLVPNISMVYNDLIDKKPSKKLINSLTLTPFSTSFLYDFIYCRHTLEHFPNPLNTLKNTYNLLSDKGIAFFEVPSFLWTEVNNVPTYDKEHLSYFTKESLENMFVICNFKILKIKESKNWGNIKILVKKIPNNTNPPLLKIKNTFRLKKLYNIFHPIFILKKKIYKPQPNS